MSVKGEPEPIYVWQVFDVDNRWGTISCFIPFPAKEITGDGNGHNLVLQTRSEELARGPMQRYAELHVKFGKPVRLQRYIPDPDFEPEEL